MARGRRGRIDWYSPDPRAILPLDEEGFRVSRSLRKRVNSGRFHVTRDHAFDQVIDHCAQPRPYSEETWISPPIARVYKQLHRLGYAHSVEAWERREQPHEEPAWAQGPLVGGLYGVAIGAAFFGESMFSKTSDASKVCLVHLVQYLRHQGFELLDVQFVNPHLQQFGVTQIPRDEYLTRLDRAVRQPARWPPGER
jgi:leucyl/phenylalanyl-tRNA--protein transferase